MISPKNVQGFRIIGTDFAKNYGKEIFGCFQFDLNNHEISVSTGACNSDINSYPGCLSEILITNITSGSAFTVMGTVEDAIKIVMEIK